MSEEIFKRYKNQRDKSFKMLRTATRDHFKILCPSGSFLNFSRTVQSSFFTIGLASLGSKSKSKSTNLQFITTEV